MACIEMNPTIFTVNEFSADAIDIFGPKLLIFQSKLFGISVAPLNVATRLYALISILFFCVLYSLDNNDIDISIESMTVVRSLCRNNLRKINITVLLLLSQFGVEHLSVGIVKSILSYIQHIIWLVRSANLVQHRHKIKLITEHELIATMANHYFPHIMTF